MTKTLTHYLILDDTATMLTTQTKALKDFLSKEQYNVSAYFDISPGSGEKIALSQTQSKLCALIEDNETRQGNTNTYICSNIYAIKYGSVFIKKFTQLLYNAQENDEDLNIKIFIDYDLSSNQESEYQTGIQTLLRAQQNLNQFLKQYPGYHEKINVNALLCSSNMHGSKDIQPFQLTELVQLKEITTSLSGKLDMYNVATILTDLPKRKSLENMQIIYEQEGANTIPPNSSIQSFASHTSDERLLEFSSLSNNKKIK